MNELQIFNSEEFGDIRTVTIENEPWFVGKDVAEALGYGNSRDALAAHIDDEDKTIIQKSDFPTLEIPNRGIVVINESGLYSLILSSKLPNAKRFKHWVTSEVLPTIRKTGSYQKPMTVAEQIKLLAQGNQDHEERIEKLENTMTIDYGQQKYLGDLVSRVVIEVLGGKKSNAYDEIGKKVFAECNRDVKTYFDVNARNNIPKLRYQEAVEYIKEWEPCTNTKMLIRDCNAQERLAE
jgi:prophage antirepressor-like protein|nr:MAG TPA: repressor domain protein [Caudoviricetes sp.]